MRSSVKKISAEDWAKVAPDAHRAVFGETLPPEFDRIDFALLSINPDTEVALGYMTCRELDGASIYLKHGGAFPPITGTVWSWTCYLDCLAYLETRYKRMTTLVENTNDAYLRMALKAGFKPIGIRNFKGTVLVELLMGEE